MANAIAQMELDERWILYGLINILTAGQFQITAAQWALYDRLANKLAGPFTLTTANYDALPAYNQARAWISFSPNDYSLSVNQAYTVRFTVNGVGTDGISRTYEPTVDVYVTARGVKVATAVQIKDYERLPLYATLTIPSGITFTISSATWDLLVADGTVLQSGLSVGGNTTGATASSVSAWADFAPADYTLAQGTYYASYLISGTSSDQPSITRACRVNIAVSVICDNS